MGLELRVVISANIKSTIAVILSPNSSRYDLQKPRYDFTLFALNEIADFLIFLHGWTRLACRGLVTMMITYTFQQ